MYQHCGEGQRSPKHPPGCRGAGGGGTEPALCFSPGKQLPLLLSRLCFSQEEKTPVAREPRGSLALPTRHAREGLPWADGRGAHGWDVSTAGPGCVGSAGTQSPVKTEDSGRRQDAPRALGTSMSPLSPSLGAAPEVQQEHSDTTS